MMIHELWGLAGAGLGAIVGSYLATVLLRWPRGDQASRGRSRCDRCQTPLAPRDLIPLLSFALARGRCRHCGAAIDPSHAAVELLAAGIGALSLGFLSSVAGLPAALSLAVFGWWLLLIAALDLRHQWIPDRLSLPLVPAGLLAAWWSAPALSDRLIGAAAGFVSLWLVARLYRVARGREGMGGADPKLFAGIGAWLGWAALPVTLAAAGLLGLAAAAALALAGHRLHATTRVPLGTFLAAAALPIAIWTQSSGEFNSIQQNHAPKAASLNFLETEKWCPTDDRSGHSDRWTISLTRLRD